MQKVLILENDLFLSQSITEALEYFGYKITQAHTIERAHSQLDIQKFDIILCDRVLDDGDGLEVVRYLLEAHYETRIIMMSQKGRLIDKLDGFDDGVDDYIVKPFSIQELIARIKVLLKKNKVDIKNMFTIGPVHIQPEKGVVILDTKPVRLRKKEMGLLVCLARHKNYLVTRKQLINTVWPDVSKQPVDSTVDVYIRRIRMKLGQYSKYIQTSRGYGYSIVTQVK